MRAFILAITLTAFSGIASADIYKCEFRGADGDYKIVFNYGSGNSDIIPTEIFRNGKSLIKHAPKRYVDSDSHGDGWSLKLRDRSMPKYKYELFFDAMYLSTVYVTMPGYKDERIKGCRRIRK